MQLQICDSQRLHFSVTTASSLLLNEPLLYRRGSSSSYPVRNFEKCDCSCGESGSKQAKSAFFQSMFLALQTLHFCYTSNKSKYSKGFQVVTPSEKEQNLLQTVTDYVTKRNRSVTNRLLQVW
jgi:hypothetical protein